MLIDYFVSKRIVRLGDQLRNKITQKVSYIQYNLKYKYLTYNKTASTSTSILHTL